MGDCVGADCGNAKLGDGGIFNYLLSGPLDHAELVDIHLAAAFGFSAMYGYYHIIGRERL